MEKLLHHPLSTLVILDVMRIKNRSLLTGGSMGKLLPIVSPPNYVIALADVTIYFQSISRTLRVHISHWMTSTCHHFSKNHATSLKRVSTIGLKIDLTIQVLPRGSQPLHLLTSSSRTCGSLTMWHVGNVNMPLHRLNPSNLNDTWKLE